MYNHLVVGHKGNLVFGQLEGKEVMCLQGRFHPYEHDMDLALVSTNNYNTKTCLVYCTRPHYAHSRS